MGLHGSGEGDFSGLDGSARGGTSRGAFARSVAEWEREEAEQGEMLADPSKEWLRQMLQRRPAPP
jgi:hypothetical protein